MEFTVAHISDLHIPIVGTPHMRSLLNKRALGWLSWSYRRKKDHRVEVLEALIADLKAAQPDHTVVTGDLTNLGLEAEFRTAVAWLQQIGDPQQVSVVPGNHDAYIRLSGPYSRSYWSQYIQADAQGPAVPHPSQNPVDEFNREFPTVRVRGPVAFIGVSSARPTGLLSATGTVGARQLEKLAHILQALADSALCRVVLMHHPPIDEGITPRRRLSDAASFRAVLARTGAELVLHGHTHTTSLTTVSGPEKPIPVIGVRSASDLGRRLHRQAQYHVYTIERLAYGTHARQFRLAMATRGYDPVQGCFRYLDERVLA